MAGSKRERNEDSDKKKKKSKKSFTPVCGAARWPSLSQWWRWWQDARPQDARKSPRLHSQEGDEHAVVDPSKPRDFGSLGGLFQMSFPERSLVAEAIAATEQEEQQWMQQGEQEDEDEPMLNLTSSPTEKTEKKKSKREKEKKEKKEKKSKKQKSTATDDAEPPAEANDGEEANVSEEAKDDEGAKDDEAPMTMRAKDDDAAALENFRICEETKEALRGRGITALFPIQVGTFNAVYDGKDMIARAKTGSGKTLGFALPIIERLKKAEKRTARGRKPVGLVLLPTRELAKQVNTPNTPQHASPGRGAEA